MSAHDPFCFMPAGGATGALVRSIDWTRHPLGVPAHWHETLKTTLGTLFGSRHPMFLFWGPELFCFYNDAYMPSFGKGKHPSAMGQRGEECWPEIWHIIGPQIEGVMSRGEATWHVNHLVPIFRNGQIEQVYWTYGYSPVYLPDAKVGGTLVVCTETTSEVIARAALEQSEVRLRHSEELLSSAIEVSQIGFYDWDIQTDTINFSEQMKNDWGISSGGTLQAAIERIHADDRARVSEQVSIAMRDGTPYRTEYRVVRPDGEVIWVEAQGRVTYDAEHKPLRFFGTSVNITRSVSNRMALEDANARLESLVKDLRQEREQREQFVAALTHDLRTPLTAAKMSAQLLMRKADDTTQKMAARIAANMDRADQMIRDLLDASRIKAGEEVPLTVEACDLNAFMLAMIEGLTSIHGDRFVLDADVEINGYWDRAVLQRILENLAGNAVKYGDPTAPITLGLTLAGDDVVISVHNAGPPIPTAELKLLFKPFQRATAAARSGHKGWGIGLTLVRGFAEAHGGSVSATSTAAHGTTFWVRVPRDARTK